MAKRPPNDGWEVPDLDLGPEPVSRARAPGGSRKSGSNSKPNSASEALELDPIGRVPMAGTAHPQLALDPLEDDFDDGLAIGLGDFELAGDKDLSAPTEQAREAWPHLRPIGPDNFAPTVEEVEAVRAWGEPPRHPLATPSYAFWVYRGQRSLEQRIVEQTQQVLLRDAARSEVALEWFEQHRSELANDPRYASEFHGLAHVLAELEAKSHTFSQLTQQVENSQNEAEQAIVDSRERIRAKRAEQASLNEGREAAMRDLSREKARRQRLDIELRAGHLDAATYAQQATALEAGMAAVQARLDGLGVEATQLGQRLLADEIALRGQEDKLGRQQRQEQQKKQAVAAGLDQARSQASVAKLELLARLLMMRDAELFAPSVRAQWLSKQSELEQAARHLACLLAARDSFDREKVRQGLHLVLLALALLLVPLIVSAL